MRGSDTQRWEVSLGDGGTGRGRGPEVGNAWCILSHDRRPEWPKQPEQRGYSHGTQLEGRTRTAECVSERSLEFILRVTAGHFLVTQGQMS